MKCLTLTQPYATLIALGEKRIETRSWGTSYRGPLALHAAKNWPNEDREWQFSDPDWITLLRRIGYTMAADFPRGAVVATARLVDCVRMGPAVYGDPPLLWIARHHVPLSAQEQMLGGYAPGRYAWLLDDGVPLPAPVPARGQLGLWDWDAATMKGAA